ncbi:MAG TPA: glycoside hydrolase family 16 protein [Candidatus Limnocylindrales bacterium]|nr:glycoside hydrolase family 16 protein [Candidatus Limnocylindrales bacterium]
MTPRPDPTTASHARRLDRAEWTLEVEDLFGGPDLDRDLWLPWYLPHWSSRARSAARYDLGPTGLRLRIDADQPPWNPEMDGAVRVSSLQTGQFSGPEGSRVGQHRFRDGLTVREAQPNVALYAPRYRLIELVARMPDDPDAMAALWMIGYEDEPERSAEICVCEVFGRDVRSGSAVVGVGLHPFGDPAIRDDFARPTVAIDVREPHSYAAAWTPDQVAFYVDDRPIHVVPQSPAYPMQVMLSLYDFRAPDAEPDPARHPKVFAVEAVRAYRRAGG